MATYYKQAFGVETIVRGTTREWCDLGNSILFATNLHEGCVVNQFRSVGGKVVQTIQGAPRHCC